jgi:hypothetical protein
MGRATTTTLAQLGIHVLGVGRHAERDGVGAEPSARSPRRCRRRGDPRHGPPFPLPLERGAWLGSGVKPVRATTPSTMRPTHRHARWRPRLVIPHATA